MKLKQHFRFLFICLFVFERGVVEVGVWLEGGLGFEKTTENIVFIVAQCIIRGFILLPLSPPEPHPSPPGPTPSQLNTCTQIGIHTEVHVHS